MTGTSSGCQNCFPPKDEVFLRENFFSSVVFTQKVKRKVSGKSLFWEGLQGGG
jgi:hypothetical protein